VECRTLSENELYAGKICAALDRQHPRDLFDVLMLLRAGTFNDAMRKAFIMIGELCKIPHFVIPVKAEIRKVFKRLDSCFRRNDDLPNFRSTKLSTGKWGRG